MYVCVCVCVCVYSATWIFNEMNEFVEIYLIHMHIYLKNQSDDARRG